MEEIIAGIIGIYIGGVIGTLILMTLGKIQIYTPKRKARKRSIHTINI